MFHIFNDHFFLILSKISTNLYASVEFVFPLNNHRTYYIIYTQKKKLYLKLHKDATHILYPI